MQRIVWTGVYIVVFLLFSRCISDGSRDKYIDYVKVSDNTFLGVEELIDSLDVPWDMQYNATTHSIFFTEIKGNISELDPETNKRNVIYTVPNVYHHRTLGLLGLAIHPDFENQPYLYTCYTTKEGKHIFSELLRLRYEKGVVSETKVLLKIEGATGHNGSRLVFGKDDFLYWATGDAHSKTYAQDSTSLNGKILRMTDEGGIPTDNPIKGSYVYAWGFRNMQGLTVTSSGHIIASEHGDAIEDELNWIRPLHNYGWKKIEGYHDLPEEQEYAREHRTTEPIKSWTPVIAPAAVHYPLFNKIPEWKNSLLLGNLKDQSLRVLELDRSQTKVVNERIYLKDYYGRIRAITSDHKGNVYIATSNRDWKPQTNFPVAGDDRILKLSLIDFVPEKYQTAYEEKNLDMKSGKALYTAYCASCHGEDGKGAVGSVPSLRKTEWVMDESKFLDVVLNGLTQEIEVGGVKYDQPMPAFNFLKDEEIAEITTYVRTSFGNTYANIAVTKVKDTRAKK